MGNRYSFFTDPEEMKFMTLDEVKAGVRAIKAVADQHRDRFWIVCWNETAIVVDGRLEKLTENFCFQPTEITEGAYKGMFYLPEYGCCCKTNHPHEDAVVSDMITELDVAVNHKLCMSG